MKRTVKIGDMFLAFPNRTLGVRGVGEMRREKGPYAVCDVYDGQGESRVASGRWVRVLEKRLGQPKQYTRVEG